MGLAGSCPGLSGELSHLSRSLYIALCGVLELLASRITKANNKRNSQIRDVLRWFCGGRSVGGLSIRSLIRKQF